jgi:hypothetical protein
MQYAITLRERGQFHATEPECINLEGGKENGRVKALNAIEKTGAPIIIIPQFTGLIHVAHTLLCANLLTT